MSHGLFKLAPATARGLVDSTIAGSPGQPWNLKAPLTQPLRLAFQTSATSAKSDVGNFDALMRL